MRNAHIDTASGTTFDLLNPREEEVLIADIAYSLCNIRRFTGHTDYTVGQHSILCSMIVPPEYALEALLHDAHEAYVGDVSYPLKALLPDYRKIEASVERVVRRKFGLPEQMSDVVRRADRELAKWEAHHLLYDPEWCEGWESVPLNYWDVLGKPEPVDFILRYKSLTQ